MKKDNTSTLSQLGSKETKYAYSEPSVEILEVFQNKFPERDYEINLEFAEFTSLCPKTGQPDMGIITIKYNPGAWCLETKSLKLYFFAFRQSGTFMETIANTILEDCVKACQPKYMRVVADFAARGGIRNTIVAEYSAA